MTNEQFSALVGRLEHQARNRPGSYKFKVFLLAILGNGYIAAMLLLIVVLLAVLIASVTVLKAVAAKLIIIVGCFLWMILKALWVKIDPPEGTEIQSTEAPELFATVNELRRQLGAPRFDHVLMTEDFNAGVVQSPRLGIFGWHRNYLLIGLPLMKTLTVEQFKAVLAHELGHLAKGHGLMSNWIYRQRLRWSRLLYVLEGRESKGSFLFKPFLNRFAPYFNAFSFPMARANEYEADAASVRLTSPQAATEALTNVTVVGSYLEERYWPGIYRLADEQPYPGFAPYFNMSQGVAAELDEASTREWMTKAMAVQTDWTDTHPALNDRLTAIGEHPRVALPAVDETSDRLLGAVLNSLTDSFDRKWKDAILSSWEERYHLVQGDRRQLAELNQRIESGVELTLQEAYDRAMLTETVGNDADDALAQLNAMHEQAPDDAVICLSLGARLLDRDDEGGCTLVERAMHTDENCYLEGCELLYHYHSRNGRDEAADQWYQRLAERSQLQEAAAKERNELLLSDRFERHGLAAEVVEELVAALRAIPGLRKAYFVKKHVKHLTYLPCYVLGYHVTGFFQLRNKRRAAEVLQRIQETTHFPGETLIINVEGPNYRFGRKFRWMRGARLL